MKKLLLFFCVFFTIFCSQARSITPSTRIALIDLTLRSPYSYRVLNALEKAVGTTLVYLHPSKNLTHDLCGCDGVFVAFDQYFLAAEPSEYTNLTIDSVKQFMAQGKKILCLLLPEQSLDSKNSSLVIKFLNDIQVSSRVR